MKSLHTESLVELIEINFKPYTKFRVGQMVKVKNTSYTATISAINGKVAKVFFGLNTADLYDFNLSNLEVMKDGND